MSDPEICGHVWQTHESKKRENQHRCGVIGPHRICRCLGCKAIDDNRPTAEEVLISVIDAMPTGDIGFDRALSDRELARHLLSEMRKQGVHIEVLDREGCS